MNAKPKLEVLDALRGFCALAVMLLHLTELTPYKFIVPHAYLPVEYFLILTGFTFVYAYDSRWGQMSVGAFLWRRLKRMHPLVIVGSLIGLVALCLNPARMLSFGQNGRPELWLAILYSFLLLPAPQSWGCSHLLQPQLWTLQYIYLANILYAFVLRHLKTWMIAILAVGAAALSYWNGLRFNGLEAGWVLEPQHVIIALTRMAFPVLAGMFIARRGWKIPCGRLALPVTVAILAALFCAPHQTGTAAGLFDATAAVFVIPLVLLLGAGGRIENARVAAVCRWLGRFSFPLYATHFMFRSVMMAWFREHPAATDTERILVIVGTGVVMLVFAWAAMTLIEAFDRRFRK